MTRRGCSPSPCTTDTSTSVAPGRVPWLHTVTDAVKGVVGSTVDGTESAETTKSGRRPTPMGALRRMLLSATNSGLQPQLSAMAPRYQVPSSPTWASPPCTSRVAHCPGCNGPVPVPLPYTSSHGDSSASEDR